MLPPCTKRRFGSPRAARQAHKAASFRVWTYYCEECRAYHVSNAQKDSHDNWRGEDVWQNRKRARERRQRGKSPD